MKLYDRVFIPDEEKGTFLVTRERMEDSALLLFINNRPRRHLETLSLISGTLCNQTLRGRKTFIMEIEFLIPTKHVVEFKRAVKENGVIKIIKSVSYSEGTYLIKAEINNLYDLICVGSTMGVNQCYDSIGFQEAKAAVNVLFDKVQEVIDQNKKPDGL